MSYQQNNDDRCNDDVDLDLIEKDLSHNPQQNKYFLLTNRYVMTALFAIIIGALSFSTYQWNDILNTPVTKDMGDAEFEVTRMYKFTSSIATNSSSTVAEFVGTYLGSTISYDLGCNTEKTVIQLGTHFELHWVDSDVFEESGYSITEWSNIIKSYGYDSFNDFMHNKIQLYVPHLQTLYDTVSGDGIDVMYRLSKSRYSDHIDIAHIGIFVKEAATVYELVGPSSTLSSSAIANFQEWESTSCPDAHSLQRSLRDLNDFYDAFYDDYTSEATLWYKSTGLYLPMLVQIQVPTSSIDGMGDTIDLVSSVSNSELTYTSSNDGQCQYATLVTASSDGGLSSVVTYVENNANVDPTGPTIADWELQIIQSHTELIPNVGWNRYLDTHMAFQTVESLSTTECDGSFLLLESDIADTGDYNYAIRVSDNGTHSYIGVTGIRSWEFNLQSCTYSGSDYPDICGCVAANNNQEYFDSDGSIKSCLS